MDELQKFGDKKYRSNRFSYSLILLVCLTGAAFLAYRYAAPPVKYEPPGLAQSRNLPEGNQETALSVLTANIGNSNFRCLPRYSWHLCFTEVETRIMTRLSTLQPDIVALQELVHPDQCADAPEENAQKVCFNRQNEPDDYQVRRLLGDNYTIACDPLYHRDCIGVHVDVGTIADCDQGSYCEDIGQVAMAHSDCNDMFIVFAVDAWVHGKRLRVVNAHPENRNVDTCRTFTVRQIFEEVDGRPPLANGAQNLLLGDFNMDPFRFKDSTTELWHTYVGMPGSGRSFSYHSGPAEQWPPFDTFRLGPYRRILDFVASDFAEGNCEVLGVTPGTKRLDGGKGMDHRAISCRLFVDESNYSFILNRVSD